MHEPRMPWWSVSLRGLAMGAADVVPGVSGGTMALVLGIYPRFISALSRLDLGLLRRLWTAARQGDGLRPIRRELVASDVSFLAALALGIGVAVLSLARVIPSLLERYPAEMNGLFFGMILASTALPFRLMEKRGPAQVAACTVSAVFAFWVVGLPVLQVAGGLGYLFGSGAIAISAMLLPGISGSFLLLILGQYTRVLEAIHQRELLVLGVFGLGVATGLLAFSRLLRWLLDRHPSTMLAALCGLMVGSLRKIWPYKVPLSEPLMVDDKVVQGTKNVWITDPAHGGSVLMPAVLLLVGFVGVLALERIGSAKRSE